jgi:hypothetical protein
MDAEKYRLGQDVIEKDENGQWSRVSCDHD